MHPLAIIDKIISFLLLENFSVISFCNQPLKSNSSASPTVIAKKIKLPKFAISIF